MRIGSISKPLTAVALLQLWQKHLVDLDAPIQQYVPEFPQKTFGGKPVDITTRMLLSLIFQESGTMPIKTHTVMVSENVLERYIRPQQ